MGSAQPRPWRHQQHPEPRLRLQGCKSSFELEIERLKFEASCPRHVAGSWSCSGCLPAATTSAAEPQMHSAKPSKHVGRAERGLRHFALPNPPQWHSPPLPTADVWCLVTSSRRFSRFRAYGPCDKDLGPPPSRQTDNMWAPESFQECMAGPKLWGRGGPRLLRSTIRSRLMSGP